MKKIKNKNIWIGTIIVIAIFLYASNNWIQNTRYIVLSDKISEPIRIVHLSDLHGKQFGKDNTRLIKNIEKETPHIIVFTGDLIDSYRNDNIQESVQFLEKLSQTTPVYYIRGNHEYGSKYYDELIQYLSEIKGNFYFLDGKYDTIQLKGQNLHILGLDTIKEDSIDGFSSEKGYKIILDHYPENLSQNASFSGLGGDLVLTGHAHGGQWRLPIIGGVYSPGQGFNPKYYEGMHQINHSAQIISRGLGNSIIPLRLFNRPEVITITIK